MKGGTNDEEFRTAAVIDRVNTTFAVWMGTTMACAQCHTHKYDPITNREFFQVYAFLNQSADSDKKDESPIHEVIDPAVKSQRLQWVKEQKNLQAKLAKPQPEWLEGFDDWLASKPKITDAKIKAALEESIEKRTKEQIKLLEQHFVKNVSKATQADRARIAELQKILDETKPITVPIMRICPLKDVESRLSSCEVIGKLSVKKSRKPFRSLFILFLKIRHAIDWGWLVGLSIEAIHLQPCDDESDVGIDLRSRHRPNE